MSENEVRLKIIENASSIAKTIRRGNDVEIVKTSSGISIKEVSKRKLT